MRFTVENPNPTLFSYPDNTPMKAADKVIIDRMWSGVIVGFIADWDYVRIKSTFPPPEGDIVDVDIHEEDILLEDE